MKLRSLLKGAMLVTVSALLIAIVTLLGLVAFVYYNSNGGRDWSTPMENPVSYTHLAQIRCRWCIRHWRIFVYSNRPSL